MTQSLAFDLQQTVQIVKDAGLFVSLCTVKRRADPPAVDARGQVDMSASAYSTTVLAAIPCMKAVEMKGKPNMSGVTRLEQRFDTMTDRHTLLDGWFPQIEERDIAIISDYDQNTGLLSETITYEIMAVEHSSQGVMTRLALKTFVI